MGLIKAALAPDYSEPAPLRLGCCFRACLVLLIIAVVAAFASCSLAVVALVLSLLEWFSPPGMPSLRVYITLEVYVTMRSCLLVLSHQLCHVTKNYSRWVRFVSVGVLSLELDSVGEFS